MKIDRILAGIRESQNAEKVASAAPAPAATPAPEKQAALVNALNEALAPAEKVAAAAPTSPVNDVMKVAAEIAQAEQGVAVKEAQLLGTAFADAAISRIAEWNKTAAAMLNNGEKLAGSSDEQLKQAALAGYEQAKKDMEKEAEEAYVQGYNDTVEAIHKTAADEFLKAAALTRQIIQASVQK